MKKNILILLLFLLISGIVSCHLGNAADWDFLAYHYYSGYAALTGRVGYDLMPAGIQSYLNPILDIIQYALINSFHNFPKLVSFILGLYWGFLAFVLYLINNLLFSRSKKLKGLNNIIIFSAVILSVTECTIVSEIGMSFCDIPVAAVILTSLYLLLKSIYIFNNKNKFYLLFLSGLFAGIASGLKLTSIIYAVALALTVIILGFDKDFKKYLSKIIILLAGMSLGFLATNGYWMYILYKNFGNPMFPLYNEIFKSNLYSYLNYHDYRFINHNLANIVAGPVIWTMGKSFVSDLYFFDLRHCASYFILLGFLIRTFYLLSKRQYLKLRQNIMSICIMIFCIISYFIWVYNFGILRYLMPVLALSGTVIMIFVSELIPFLKSKKIALIILTSLFLILNYNYDSPKWGRINQLPEIVDYKFKDNSVVYMYGKPASYLIVGQNPKARFVYLAGHIEDSTKDFMPSDKYIELVDKYQKNASETYVIKRLGDIPEEAKKYNTNLMVNKYLNKKMECSDANSIYKKVEPNYGVADFEVCKLINNY